MTTTPADELREAAKRLRNAAPSLPLPWRGFADPVADWLDTEAATWPGDAPHHVCALANCTLDAALRVARTINGS